MRPAALLVLLAIGSCTGGTAGRPAGGDVAVLGTLRGAITFEARLPTKQGASEALTARPARLVDLEVRAAGGEVLARGTADESGRYEVDAPAGARTLVVLSKITTAGHDVAVTLDRDGSDVHELAIDLSDVDPGAVVDVSALDEDDHGFAGALHLLDTLLRGIVAAERWTGRDLPPFYVWWGRGVTRSWSYYRGEHPRGSGRYSLELLGGQPGQQHTSDTDEHDEAIVLHELGHFVMDMVSTDSSPGGRHPPGVLVDPGLAWEEGRVTWFATAVLGAPAYWDTIGVEPRGKLRVDRDLEIINPGPQGVGSEQTVAEILWDLADGAGGIPDADDDGIALGPQAVMGAMMALTRVEGAYPALSSFLELLVELGAVEETELKGMLASTGQPAAVLPTGEDGRWPVDLTLPATVEGHIDGLTDPAPSGGPARPGSGFDATRAYRVHVTEPCRLRARLQIRGSGRVADHQDLDMELRTIRARVVSTARTAAATETLEGSVPPGWYVLYVRDGGAGNRADYALEVSCEG